MPRRCVIRTAIVGCLMLIIVALALCSGRSAGADVRARCNTAFDTEFFYFVAEIDKPVLRGSVSAPFQDPLQDDAILIGLASAQDPSRRVEMAVSVAGGAQLYRGADRRALNGPDEFLTGPDGMRMLFKYRLRPRGKLNGEADLTNGFTVEMAIPWIELGGPPKPGDRLRFHVGMLGTAEGDPPVVGLSAAVTERAGLQDPALWSEIVFVDAPTASVSAAPGAVVCARVYNVKPIIDGAFDEGEWTRVTSFAFGGGGQTGTAPADAAAARSRESIELRQAPPLPADGRWLISERAADPGGERPAGGMARQPWPRLVFARYLVDRQADARKPLPLVPAAEPSGRSLLVTHPMDGTGPWFTYDRIDWHRIQLTRMREAGVDVAAVFMQPGRQGRLAVTALAAAMEALESVGADLPMACQWLDASGLARSGEPANAFVDRVYQAVREFHQCLPARFAATIALNADNGGGVAVPVVIAFPPDLGEDGDGPMRAELRRRFRREFGRDLIVLGTRPGAWDGVVADASAEGYAGAKDRAVRVASIHAGTPNLAQGEHPLFRRSRDSYRTAWRSAITDGADWVFIDSWNDFGRASEIAPTVEYGLEYLDMTQAFSRLWRRSGDMGGHVVRATIPERWISGRTQTVRVTLRNTGTLIWSPGSFAVRAAWQSGRGSATAAIPNPVDMGGLCTVSLRIPSPEAPGMQVLTFSIVRVDRSGAPVSAPNSAAALGAHTVECVPPDHPGRIPASLISDTVLRVAEGMALHRASVVVRNDGSAAWEPGQAILRARLFEQGPEDPEPKALDLADAAASVTQRVEPGAEAAFDIAIPFVRHDGIPFRPSEHTEARYLMRWDLEAPGSEPSVVALGCQEVQIVEADFGAQFFNDYTPNELPGDRRVSVVIGIRNRGPQTWLKGKVAVGYHWYYLDGVEAVWQDEVFPINADMAPGSQIADVGAWITAPPHDGMYWLVWDLRVGDTWASTRLSARAYETRVQLVKVARGRLHFVDLASAANATITAGVGDPPLQGFNGAGAALPAELTPPFATGMPACTGLWQPTTRTGPDLNRRISFRWLPRGRANGVRCRSQVITVAPARSAPQARVVHIAAAATKPEASLGITLRFADGTEQYTSFPVETWDSTRAERPEAALTVPYVRIQGKDMPGPPVSIYRYAIAIKERKPLVSLQLSEAPDVVVTAISVER